MRTEMTAAPRTGVLRCRHARRELRDAIATPLVVVGTPLAKLQSVGGAPSEKRRILVERVRVLDPRRLAVSLRLDPIEDDVPRAAVGSRLMLIDQQSQRGMTGGTKGHAWPMSPGSPDPVDIGRGGVDEAHPTPHPSSRRSSSTCSGGRGLRAVPLARRAARALNLSRAATSAAAQDRSTSRRDREPPRRVIRSRRRRDRDPPGREQRRLRARSGDAPPMYRVPEDVHGGGGGEHDTARVRRGA